MTTRVVICGPSGNPPPEHVCGQEQGTYFDMFDWGGQGYRQRRCPECDLYYWIPSSKPNRRKKTIDATTTGATDA